MLAKAMAAQTSASRGELIRSRLGAIRVIAGCPAGARADPVSGWRALGMFWVARAAAGLGLAPRVLQSSGPPPRPVPAPQPGCRGRPPALLRAGTAAVAAAGHRTPKPDSPVAQRRAVPPPQRPGAQHARRRSPIPTRRCWSRRRRIASGDAAAHRRRTAACRCRSMPPGSTAASRRPRVGLLLAGIGMNQADSEAAIHDLPGGVTLAFSPYASRLAAVAGGRAAGRPRIPAVDPDGAAGLPAERCRAARADDQPVAGGEPARGCDWALARIAGYVGVTDALGALRGERFAGVAEQMDPVLAQIGQRGLLYVDPRPAGAGGAIRPAACLEPRRRSGDRRAGMRSIDAEAGRSWSTSASDKGSALGLAGAPRRSTVQRIAAWANGLLTAAWRWRRSARWCPAGG